MLNQFRYNVGKFSKSFHFARLAGTETESFLQKQSTFNISQLSSGEFHLISFLDSQGRVEFYAWLLKNLNDFTLLVPEALKERAFVRLNRYLVSEDVEIFDEGWKTCFFIIGPKSSSFGLTENFKGLMFDESCVIQFKPVSTICPEISDDFVDVWRILNGWPSFDGIDLKHEIINQTRLYDLSLSVNKGCYPGQETVSKIATRRGSGFAPVLIETNKSLTAGEIQVFDKKVGLAKNAIEWNGKHYLPAELLRDFRVENLEIDFDLNNEKIKGKVRYYPLLSGNNKLKAQELYYAGSDYFRMDETELAEEKFKQSIELDPFLNDALESLGVMLGRQERFQEAIELMKKLSEVDPDSVMAHTNMSLYLMRMGKINEAEEEKSKATLKSFKKFGDEAKQKNIQDEERLKQENEWAKRESMFKQVLEIDADDTLANYGLGSISVERNNWQQSIHHLEKVIGIDPNYSVAYLALGKAYKGMGDITKAKNTFEMGISIAAKRGDFMPANQMKFELDNL